MRGNGMAKRKLITKAAYAEHCGLAASTIYRQVRDGKIPTHNGQVDPKEADAIRAKTVLVDGRRKGKPEQIDSALEAAGQSIDQQPEGGASISRIKAAHETVKLRIANLDLQRKEGKLVDRQAATAAFFSEFRAVRDAWLNWPARVAAMIASELGTDARETQVLMEKYVRDQLEELADRDMAAALTNALEGKGDAGTTSDREPDRNRATSA